MNKFIFTLMFCLIAISGYTDEVITDFEEGSVEVLNEELRGLIVENQIKEGNGLNLQSKKITSLATPTATTDGATKGYVDDETSFKTGTFSRDTALATGTQAVTGVGFEPEAVIFFWAQANSKEAGVGIAVNTTPLTSNDHCIVTDDTAAADTWVYNAYAIDDREDGATDNYYGTMSSFDSDGFTISWTKVGTPTGTITIAYLAMS